MGLLRDYEPSDGTFSSTKLYPATGAGSGLSRSSRVTWSPSSCCQCGERGEEPRCCRKQQCLQVEYLSVFFCFYCQLQITHIPHNLLIVVRYKSCRELAYIIFPPVSIPSVKPYKLLQNISFCLYLLTVLSTLLKHFLTFFCNQCFRRLCISS